MFYTLSQAAKVTGKDKSTLSKAVKKGRISAIRMEDGSYRIDPAELHRVYPPAKEVQPGHPGSSVDHSAIGYPLSPPRLAELEAKLEAARERERLKDEMITELRTDRDHWRQQATALLTDGREKSPQKPVEGRLMRAWGILIGKS